MSTTTEISPDLSERALRISKLHLVMVTRHVLENPHFMNERELLKVDPITRSIVRNEVGYERGSQPTSDYDTTAELNAQLDLLFDAVSKVAPKARQSTT